MTLPEREGQNIWNVLSKREERRWKIMLRRWAGLDQAGPRNLCHFPACRGLAGFALHLKIKKIPLDALGKVITEGQV